MMTQNKFFQNESKFIVGKIYETIRVESRGYKYNNINECDEVGKIIPNSELFLGSYVKSEHYGYGDNGGRRDYFINGNGQEVTFYLDYDGTTRYRKAKTHIEERIPFLNLIESIGDKINTNKDSEHINKYILNDTIYKEVCSFMNPLL